VDATATGTVVAVSRCMLEASNGNCAAPGRFESLGISSAAAGTWTLRVESFSGSGTFRADVFGGLDGSSPPEPPPAAPSTPAGLTGTALSKSQVRLAWADTSGNESGFRVERCRGGSCTTFATVASLSAGSTAYTDSGLKAGVTYRYRVLAWNDAGVSGYSNIATVMTPATRHVAACTAGNGGPWPCSEGIPANDRMAGFTKMMYAITMNVVRPPRISPPSVAPRCRSSK